MPPPTTPPDEIRRLAALHALGILDTPREDRFDRITRLAAALLDVPIALVTLVNGDRHWFKSAYGIDVTESPLDSLSFCGHAIHSDAPFIVPNALVDPRFAGNPLVTGEVSIRFYAGRPLSVAEGSRVGTLCVMDRQPRTLSATQMALLEDLAHIAEDELNSARQNATAHARLAAIVEHSNDAIYSRTLDGRILSWNAGAERMLGYAAADVIGEFSDFAVPPARPSKLRKNTERLLRGEQVERETDRLTKDGRVIHVFNSHSPIRDEAGNIVGVSTIMKDITTLKQAQAALKASEVRFRAIFEQAAAGIAHYDLENRSTIVNRRYSEITGYTQEELMDPPPNYLSHPDDFGSGKEQRSLLLSGAIPQFSNDKRYVRKDGTVIWVTRTESLVRDDNGAPLYFIRIIEDITERRRLQDSLQLTQFSIDRAVDAVFWIKPNAQIIYVNDAACRALGYAREDIVGKTVFEIDPHFSADAWPAHWQELKQRKSLLFESGHYTADGKYRQTEVTANYIEFQGQEYNCAFMRDITERKLAAATRALLATIVENAAGAIISRTLDGVITSFNAGAEKLFGYSAAEAVGQSINLITPPAHDHIVQDHSRLLSSGKSIPPAELALLAKDGTRVHVIRSISPIKNGAQTVIGAAIIMHDISPLKRAEEARVSLESQLRESQKMQAIGTLAGGIAHDFNNIIAIILGNVELAREDMSQNPHAQVCLEHIQLAGVRARDLVRQILAFSRRQPTLRKPIRLSSVAEETTRLLRATLPARLSLDLYCAPNVPPVLADATQVQQTLINLATNAMQAMPSAGHIELRLETVVLDAALIEVYPHLQELQVQCAGNAVRLTVSDNGPGMDVATRERIFEPFFTTKPLGEGTGLGLSVVHGIVTAHGGAITVDSQPGRGSTFALYFPATTEPAQASVDTRGAAVSPTLKPDGGPRIIYIDDDTELVFLVQRLLERRGYRISAHSDSRAALQMLRADPAAFDLVLTDYNMPGMSGLDVAEAVRTIRADLPVAVTSGFIDETLQSKAAAAGVRELIFKADTVQAFCDTVHRLTEKLKR